MTNSTKDFLHGLIILMLFITVIVGIPVYIFSSVDNAKLEKEAIEHGYAEYVVVDKLTGRVEFHWKDNIKKETK